MSETKTTDIDLTHKKILDVNMMGTNNCGFCAELHELWADEILKFNLRYRHSVAIVQDRERICDYSPEGQNVFGGFPLNYCPECGKKITM